MEQAKTDQVPGTVRLVPTQGASSPTTGTHDTGPGPVQPCEAPGTHNGLLRATNARITCGGRLWFSGADRYQETRMPTCDAELASLLPAPRT